MDLLSTLIALAGLVVVIVAAYVTPLGPLDAGKLGDYPAGRASARRE